QWQDLRFERNAVWALVYFAVWRWSVFLKDCIACVSFDVLNNLPPRLAARTRVVYNHVDEAAVGHPASSAGQDDSASAIRWISEQQRGGKKVVLAFGLFRRRKNLVSLIQAVEQMPDTALLLVGEGHDEPRLRMAASALQRQGRFL